MRPQLYPTASPDAPMSPTQRRWRYERALKATGDVNHPAVQGAAGRWLASRLSEFDGPGGAVPQRNSVSPEAIAWYRESRAWPGYMNRHRRKKLLKLLTQPQIVVTE